MTLETASLKRAGNTDNNRIWIISWHRSIRPSELIGLKELKTRRPDALTTTPRLLRWEPRKSSVTTKSQNCLNEEFGINTASTGQSCCFKGITRSVPTESAPRNVSG